MINDGFELQPITPALGAEVLGLELGRLSDATFSRLYQHWLDYKLLVIRDQSIELASLLEFSHRFGDLMILPYIEPLQDFPEIIRVLKQADEVNMGVFGGDWHSDFSFLETPPQASILYAEDIPPLGGDTLWVNMALAWQTLAQDLQSLLRDKTAIHVGAPYGVQHAPAQQQQFKGSIAIERNNPEADREVRHPLVCRHPQNDQEMLFINPTYTTRIDGMRADDSAQMLQRLYAHCCRPEFACRLRWQPGSIVIWDNRNTMHYAVNDYDGYRRCLYRTTIKGEAPLPAS